MFLFTVILIPATLVFYCVSVRDKMIVAVSLCGILSGFFVCICTSLFTFMHRVPLYSFGSNFSYYASREYILPIVLLFCVYFFVTKDDFSFKTRAFFPLSLGFLSVFVPYITVSAKQSAFSFYELFAKPVIWLSMVIFLKNLVVRLFSSGTGTKRSGGKLSVIMYSVLVAFVLFVPPFINALWVVNWLNVLSVITGLFYVLFAVALCVLPLKKRFL